MKISQFTVHRPKLTTMMVLIVIIIGGVSMRRLPVDLMPDISYPTLTISATYENASPEEVEELVTRPIEEAMSAVPGVEEISSESAEGSSRVRVSFAWGTNLDNAASDVRDRLDRVINRLPEEMDRPTLRKFDPSSMPILVIGASSNLDPIQVRRIIDEQIKYRIERVPGVAALDVMGGREREIRINLNADRVKSLGVPLDQVLNSIKAGNITLPSGTVERGQHEVIIRTPGEYGNLEQLRDTVIADINGVPVRLKDIAAVEDTAQKVTRLVRVNGQPGVQLSITKQSGKNTVEVAQRVLAEVEKINQDLRQIKLVPIVDSSEYIKRSISSVGSSALYGGGFAILVLLIFLANIFSTAIIAVAIPISIIAAFALMYFSGFTLNIMTLGGLALGVGMLVDNSIVVLENIYRLREDGLDAETAAVEGSSEVTAAVIASTLTTVVVFLPLIFIQGMAGVMFTQLALVVSFALLASLAVSLTVVPMLASKYLHPVDPKRLAHETLAHRLLRLNALWSANLENAYKRILHRALNHQKATLVGVSILLLISLALAPLVGMELMPQSDEGEVRVNGEMAVGTKLSVMDEKFQAIESIILRETPEMKNMVATIGSGGGRMGSGGHVGQFRISLKPRAERKRSSEQVVSDLRRELSNRPGVTIRPRAGTGQFTGMMTRGFGSTERVQVEIRGYDLATADALAEQVKEVVERVDGITDAQLSRESGVPEELVIIDRAKAADLRLSVSQIAQMLQTSLGGSTAGYYREGGSEYRIFVQLENPEKMEVEDILNLTLTNAAGEPITLRNVVKTQPHEGPVSIQRSDQERIVTVSANTSDRDIGSILRDIRRDIQSVPVPSGFTINFGGEYEQQQESFQELGWTFVLALILVYMVMVSLYESLRDPFVVMFSIPPAAIGVVWLLFLTNTTFNMQSIIGCIMLGRIVVNNAIVLVDQINLLRRRDGMALREAIEEAGRRRLRPILMTALTTMLGLVPMALGLGEGGEFQAPLARAVIGGLFSATLITLVVVPVVYSIFEQRLAKS
ncbi:MAG TPA: efflux RND transporter permease subunit [bacterium]|nr:efflux RND transporter permease subunit [bacterium]HNS48273.1 efflux RND transporter permease subunit [bacterium]